MQTIEIIETPNEIREKFLKVIKCRYKYIGYANLISSLVIYILSIKSYQFSLYIYLLCAYMLYKGYICLSMYRNFRNQIYERSDQDILNLNLQYPFD